MRYISIFFSALFVGLLLFGTPTFAADQNTNIQAPSGFSIFWHDLTDRITSLFSKPTNKSPKTTETKPAEQTSTKSTTPEKTETKPVEQAKPGAYIEKKAEFSKNKKGQRVKLDPNKNIPPSQVKAAQKWITGLKKQAATKK